MQQRHHVRTARVAERVIQVVDLASVGDVVNEQTTDHVMHHHNDLGHHQLAVARVVHVLDVERLECRLKRARHDLRHHLFDVLQTVPVRPSDADRIPDDTVLVTSNH